MSLLVTNLVDRGWVRRHAADEDGRGVLLQLPEDGVAAAAAQDEARDARFRCTARPRSRQPARRCGQCAADPGRGRR